MDMTPRFKVSYDGESEYDVGPYTVRVRRFAHARNTRDDYFPTVRKQVGTIMNRDYGNYHKFPPPEVCAFWPDAVPARWTEDFQVEYLGPAPRIVDRSYDFKPDDPDADSVRLTTWSALALQKSHAFWDE